MFTAIIMSVVLRSMKKGVNGAKVAYLPRVVMSLKQNAKPFFLQAVFFNCVLCNHKKGN